VALCADLRDEFGLEVDPRTMITHPSVRRLAAHLVELAATVEQGQAAEHGAAVEPADAVPQPGPGRPRSALSDVRRFEEVRALRERIEELEGVAGNPYFQVHEGTIRDRTVVDGRELVCFSSYNYLGLSGHPEVTRAAQLAVERYGTSVSASRLVAGERPLHAQLERAVAELVGTEDALTLVSGHATNLGVIGHLMGQGDLVVHDGRAHDSILQGCALTTAQRLSFPHNDVAALDALLGRVRSRFRRVLIVVEGGYSMDGDAAPLPDFVELSRRHDTLLMVDEAHSIGVLGATGGGAGQHFGVAAEDVDIWMGTLSKALAATGGYLAGSRDLIQYLRYTLPGFVFSAGLSPGDAAAALAAVRVIGTEPERLTRLRERSELFLRLAIRAGVDVGDASGTPIVPCITGDSTRALLLSRALFDRGFSVGPILAPAVEEHAARLRFFVTAEHTVEQIEQVVAVLAEELRRLPERGALSGGRDGSAAGQDAAEPCAR